ncbi:MAG: hypothetical protein K0R90_128 [Oscillospiraceae bacterium]|jgi:hypothetical protein|nr:hypothetical protein [Oscillospiraceae bacterium]
MYIVDKIEETFAVCEDEKKSMHDIPLEILPKEICVGDVIKKDHNDNFYIDKKETDLRKQQVINLQNQLFE